MSHMLATPEKPLYILKEHLASEPVTLCAKHHGKGGFTFSNTSQGASGEVLLTIDSRSGGVMASKRLIKDATGKGILELWRDVGSDESYIQSSAIEKPAIPLVITNRRWQEWREDCEGWDGNDIRRTSRLESAELAL